MPTAEQITHHPEPDPDENPWVQGPPEPQPVVLVDYDPRWPEHFQRIASGIRDALGDVVLDLEHVGSTSVPGLAAKNIIDIDLTVADSRDEQRYVPALERIGYQLVIREPSFHEHRSLNLADREVWPRVNLHVFGPDCPETIRHRMFRDWLRAHPDDRDRYEKAKRDAIPGGGNVMAYNGRKEQVIRDIYQRMFHAAGLL
jgi:GrpB-like predicted nucleotidyltransferase (UPF0157 family)